MSVAVLPGQPWVGRRRQPQRHLDRLHRLLDHGSQLGGEAIQVDLLAQAGRESLDRAGGVIVAPVEATVDPVLDPDYLIDLRHHGPPAVRRWLRGAAKMRIIGSAYHPANDANYAITVDPWHAAFDTILHLDEVTPSRLLADSG
jgi:hypothetical protein